MLDLEQFEADLVELVLKCGVNEYVHQTGGHVAARVIEFIKLMKDCHEFDRDIELSLAPDRRPLLPPHLEPLVPDTGATSARRRTVHIEQHEIVDSGTVIGTVIGRVPRPLHLADDPPPSEQPRIEALPATEDWCACGWSEEPHLRSEHEPAGALSDDAPTPPHATCGRFVSQRGAFATGPDDLCVRCGASGRAHGITRLGPPSQIAETLTQNED